MMRQEKDKLYISWCKIRIRIRTREEEEEERERDLSNNSCSVIMLQSSVR